MPEIWLLSSIWYSLKILTRFYYPSSKRGISNVVIAAEFMESLQKGEDPNLAKKKAKEGGTSSDLQVKLTWNLEANEYFL